MCTNLYRNLEYIKIRLSCGTRSLLRFSRDIQEVPAFRDFWYQKGFTKLGDHKLWDSFLYKNPNWVQKISEVPFFSFFFRIFFPIFHIFVSCFAYIFISFLCIKKSYLLLESNEFSVYKKSK